MDLVHEKAKTTVHAFVHRLGIEVFEHGRGVGNIREEDRDALPFTFNGTAGRENLFCKMLWGVRMRLVVIKGLRPFGLAQIVAAVATELVRRWVFRFAFRANKNELLPTFSAKLSCLGVIRLAIWALHDPPFWPKN
jgi:hypothetical protein